MNNFLVILNNYLLSFFTCSSLIFNTLFYKIVSLKTIFKNLDIYCGYICMYIDILYLYCL